MAPDPQNQTDYLPTGAGMADVPSPAPVGTSESLCVSQLNIHRSPAAGDEILLLLRDIDLVQELPLKQDGTSKIFHPSKNVYCSQDHPRAAVLVHKRLISVGVSAFTSRDLATAAIQLLDDKIIYVASLYCHKDNPPTDTPITDLVVTVISIASPSS